MVHLQNICNVIENRCHVIAVTSEQHMHWESSQEIGIDLFDKNNWWKLDYYNCQYQKILKVDS